MKLNLEKIANSYENFGKISRSNFIKILGTLAISGFFTMTFNNEERPKIEQKIDKNTENQENKEEIIIIKREDWDNSWKDEIENRYKGNLGDIYSFRLKGKNVKEKLRRKYITTFPYLENNTFDLESLEQFYKRIVIHHSEMNEEEIVGEDPIQQINFLKNAQIIKGFGDIAYNFAITPNGEIFEGVPLSHIAQSAGYTKETKKYLKRHLPNGITDIAKEKNSIIKKEKINYFKNAYKMDPDYGTVNIVVLGNLNKEEPTEKQVESLKKILNYLKQGNALNIPKSNIIGHFEVKEKVVEASNLHLSSRKEKHCPGINFRNLHNMIEGLNEDTEKATAKSLLLEY